jgi:transcription antitermination factor NusA-like protein
MYNRFARKKKNFEGERLKAIMQKVDKILVASFIREVLYPAWLVNVVMVKKSNDKCWMCVDFIDLNKAYSKDSYSLLKIDHLVDATVGFEFLSSLNANSSYHQVLMHPKDEEKTTFITETMTYCCRAMPFRLKNTGATYQ